MLRSLKIENFRGFQSFELKQLGRINLFVGANNSGKTSILEAIRLLTDDENSNEVRKILWSRGEYHTIKHSDPLTRDLRFEINNLFYRNAKGEIPESSNISTDLSDASPIAAFGLRLALDHGDFEITRTGNSHSPSLPPEVLVPSNPPTNTVHWSASLAEDGTVPEGNWPPGKPNTRKLLPMTFAHPSMYQKWAMAKAFGEIVLTPDEDLLVEALQIIEPRIRRIAVIENQVDSGNSKGLFSVSIDHQSERVPLGVLGDGIWNILGLTLSLIQAKQGVLLVDEIDTGLYFSVIEKLWHLIWKTAVKLNVQVFATTHSNDCWQTLGQVARSEQVEQDDILLHRIEAGKPCSVIFDARMLEVAAERDLEVR